MDWSTEVVESLRWLGIAFCVAVAAFMALAVYLGYRTHWGRQLRQLAWPYFTPRRSWKPAAGLALMLLLTLFSVRMNVLFSFWYNGFYSALQKLDAKLVWFFIGIFAILATVHVVRALVNFYVQQAFGIAWRTWLNDHFTQRWLTRQAYYRSQHLADPIDNPDQRIQQDITNFVTTSISLSMGLVSAVVSIFAFTAILWTLSGPLTLFGYTLPRAMVFLVYLYVLVATVIAFKLGRPLIRLSFLNEKFSASYRYALMRLREYGESVAFYGGERVEALTLARRFAEIIDNAWKVVFRSLKLSGFNLAVGQAAVVFPFIVQLPRYLEKQITLGDVMQTGTAFGQVQDSLSFFRESYEIFAGYRAELNRLTGFLDAMHQADGLPSLGLDASTAQVDVRELNIRTPDGATLIANLTIDISACQPLLIRGRSGAGKTTLLRAIAGLWPFADGAVTLPAGRASLFLSQKPYLPLGTLRNALCYPMEPGSHDSLGDVLMQCQLGHLVAHLDDDADWTQRLSLGEQQRLAFGRILINKPAALFLDEATSALDEELERTLYQMLISTLPDTTIVSVGHRSTLRAFHETELVLQGETTWRIDPIEKTIQNNIQTEQGKS